MIAVVFWIITATENAEVQKDEDEEGRGFSVVLHVLLPIAGLALLWGQRGIFAKLLLQLDRSCVSVYCPSLSKREKLLKWAGDRLPTTWSSQARTLSSGIPELWKDGSLLCTIINSAVPGACPNPHRHWRKSPLHAQALAYKYLGLIPMFTEADFSTDFSINQERKFIQYLHKLQEVVTKWPTNHTLNHKFSSQYVARGMGLYTGEQNRKTIFYIYSNGGGKKRSNVFMYIRGPFGSKGSATISPFHSLQKIPVVNVLQNQLEASKTLPFKNEEQKSFLKTISLDFTSLVGNLEEKKEQNEIPIQIDMEIDRAKITYIPKDDGMYEITLICDGEILRGSPYSVQVYSNTSGKTDSFETTYENVEEKIIFTKRKVISKVIDCIDEKIYIGNTPNANSLENDEVTIMAVTKKEDEILKTEISCTLEDIIEEINTKAENDTLEEIKKITEHLKTLPDGTDETDQLQLGTLHKLVKNSEEVKTEIANLLQPDEVHYNVEKDVDRTRVSEFDFGSVENRRDEDENNNSPVKRIKSKISLEISPKIPSASVTSPICPSHIAPEVELSYPNQFTLAQKRKVFSRQNSINLPDSDVTFSLENGDSSRSPNFGQLSVLNVLNSLKQSRKNSLSEGSEHSVTSTVSMSNVASETHEESFRARKEYWERMSSRSSSSASLVNLEPKAIKRKETMDHVKKERKISNSSAESKASRYKSDTSLDDCSLIPLEERKKKLLKEMYEKETHHKKTDSLKKVPTVSDRVETLTDKKKKSSFKTQFKNAISFFKKKENIPKTDNLKRRFSLDNQRRAHRKVRGGSLSLPYISDRFQVSNLYEDVFGNRRGSFKGTPNKNEVANSLASFSPNGGSTVRPSQDEDDISYNLFVNKGKTKKRKGIKAIFYVNY